MSGLYRIPRTWNWATFQDIAEVVTGNTPPTSNAENYGGEIQFFKPPQLNDMPVCEAPETLSEKGIEKARLLPPKSVLVSCIGILGKTAITKNFSATNQQINAVIFDPHVLPEYGFYYSQTLAPWLKENSSATTVAIINKSKFELAPFPLPPTAEQTRIVEKLEELLSDLDAGVAELKAAQKKLVQYRQSLLKAAVEGKLTQHWREQRSAVTPSPQPLSHQGRGAYGVDAVNDAAANYQPHPSEKKATTLQQNPNLRNAPPSKTLPSPLAGEGPGERGQLQPTPPETGAQLLARILKQRRANWEAKQLAKFQQQGKAPPKGWQDKYPEPVKPDTTDLPELPEGWVWASLDQLTSMVRNGLSHKPNQEPIGFRILRINAVRPMSVNLDEIRYLQISQSIAADYFLENGDLLATRYNGSVDLLGVFGVVRGLTTQTLHPDKLIRIKPVLECHLADWIEISAATFESRKHIVSRVKTTAGQTGISGEDVKKMPIPLPPLAEQLVAIDDIKKLLPEISAQANYIETTLKQSAAQRKNILKSAFSGQLVSQDPNDEPASVLLERIRAERSALQTAKVTKKRAIKGMP
jgi:restriction endonuclease S subunit